VNEVPPYSASSVEVVRLPQGETEPDEIAVEEPLEIRVEGRPISVTMRTPGHDEELALGFLRSEGIAAVSARPTADLAANVIDVEVEGDVDFELVVPAVLVAVLPDRLREAQPTFAATGGLHATGLFDASGDLLVVREDVGRHNAMDKVVGWAFGQGLLPLADKMLCVSGRLSFELVQKAVVAGCPVVVAVGAPSTLAVDLARDRGVTLCGFVRGGRVNVYSEAQRIG
jgi:FdhD protein